jgi:hypothetical protein
MALALGISASSCVKPPPPTESVASVGGRVSDAAGQPLEGAFVRVNQCSDAIPVDMEQMQAVTDADGRYQFPVRWRDGESLDIRSVLVTKAGYVRSEAAIADKMTPGRTATLDFVLTPGEVIAGAVQARIEHPPDEEPRYLLTISGGDFSQSLSTEPGGTFEIYVPPGTYTLAVMHPKIELEVRSGTRDLVISEPTIALTPEWRLAAFDELWSQMDRHYSHFALKPDVDWPALRDRFRPEAADAATQEDFVEVLRRMLSELRDMHVWIETPDGEVPTHSVPWKRNWNPQAIVADLAEQTPCGEFAIVGKTRDDGFGCLIIAQQSAATAENVRQTLDQLGALRDVPGFVIDLRGGCSGGDERLAREVAQFFCGEQVVYARSRYRDGPAHDDFGEASERVLEPHAQPFIGPVVCLTGQKCMSSGEGFVMMLSALPQVTTVGQRTRGSSGNPKPFSLPGLPITVWFSRWVDLLPDGTPVEGRGIAPEIELDDPLEAYRDSDPTWRRAIDLLRAGTTN